MDTRSQQPYSSSHSVNDRQHLPQVVPRADEIVDGPAYIQGTPEMLYRTQQAAYDRYWEEHQLRMTHSQPPTYTHPSTEGSFRTLQGSEGSGLAAPYYDLPQREYVAKRRFQPKSAIMFATQTTGYIRLIDALQGTMHGLLGPDDAVFSGDNLSQKQSLRLQIDGCPPFERQINVRNPANHGKSVTRAKLAEKIAKEIADYMKRQRGPLGEPSLGLGPELSGFERIVLVMLRHVSMSSWQPVLGLLPA